MASVSGSTVPASPKPAGKKKLLFKVLVIGDYAVGKTSLIKRYTEGIYTPNYKLTIGVDFAVKVLDWDDDSQVHLQLWDVAGHERFGTMTRVYYKYAIAAVIVFDVSRPATFDAVLKWREDVNSKVVLGNGEPIPCILLANKADLSLISQASALSGTFNKGGAPLDTSNATASTPAAATKPAAGNNVLDAEAIDRFARQHNFAGWFATSALSNLNVDEAMHFVAEKVMEISAAHIPRPPDSNTVAVDSPKAQSQESSCFSCS